MHPDHLQITKSLKEVHQNKQNNNIQKHQSIEGTTVWQHFFVFFSKSLPRVMLEAIASYSPVFVRIKISASRSGFEFTSTKCLRFSPQCSTMRSITRSCCSNSKERSYSMAFNPAMNSTVAWHKKRIKTKTSLLRHGSSCLCVLKKNNGLCRRMEVIMRSYPLVK